MKERESKQLDSQIEQAWVCELTNVRQALLARYMKKYGTFSNGPYTQPNVATKIGVSKVALWNWENGISMPNTLNRFQRWAKALGRELILELR